MSELLSKFQHLVDMLGNIVWGPPFLILLIGTGIFLTFYFHFYQVKRFPHAIRVLKLDEKMGIS